MPSGMFLTPEDRELLERLLSSEGRRVRNVQAHGEASGDVDDQEFLAPEVYVARTPSGGIPALDAGSATGTGTGTGTSDVAGDVPGRANCSIWEVVRATDGTPTFSPVAMDTLEVLNLSETTIDGDKWILAVRDKFGEWWAVDPDPGTGAAAGTIDVCGVPPNTDTGTGTGTPGPGDCPVEPTTPFLIDDPLLLKFSEDFELFELVTGDCESSSGTGTGSGVHGDERKTAYLRTRGLTGEFATGIIDFRICTDCSVVKQYRVVCVKRGRVQRFFLDPPELAPCPTS